MILQETGRGDTEGDTCPTSGNPTDYLAEKIVLLSKRPSLGERHRHATQSPILRSETALPQGAHSEP